MADYRLRGHVRTLQHYFTKIYRKVGLEWSHDNDVEIEETVQGIFEEAVAAAKEDRQ